jgi:hypothetical protein
MRTAEVLAEEAARGPVVPVGSLVRLGQNLEQRRQLNASPGAVNAYVHALVSLV